MLGIQQRLRDELQCSSSLIHILRSTDREHAFWILDQLRRGAYDGILLGAKDGSRLVGSSDGLYPWEMLREAENQQVQSDLSLHSMQFFKRVLS